MLHVVACRLGVCALVAIPLVLASCGGPNNPQPKNAKKTIPVHGEVYIDGKPGYGVQVHLNPKGGPETGNTTVSLGDVGEDGKYEIRTYATNDGAPAGEYALTFEWLDRSKPVRLFGSDRSSPDQFAGKYADAKKSEHPLSVPEGSEGVDAGRIDLKK